MNSDNNNEQGNVRAKYTTNEEFIDQIRTNVKSDLIKITEDKIENILLKNLRSVGIRKSFITPLSILIAAMLALLTANFKDKFGINRSTWEAFFLLVVLFSFLWLIISLVRICFNWKKGSLSNLVAVIKNAKEKENTYMEGTLKIIKARYGVEDKYIDITERLKQKIENNVIKEIVNNSLAGEDPYPGHKKELKLNYRYRSKESSLVIDENKILVIP